MLINRIPLASFTNNKALHDFYSVNGSLVVNRRGEVMAGLKPEDLQDSVKPLQLIPVPYNTDLKGVVADSLITQQAKMASQMLPERNFIRSRIGNSGVFGFNSRAFRGNYLQGREFRLKFGLFSKRYEYNDLGKKRGVLDYFNGCTLSYGFGSFGEFRSEVPRERVHLLKGGIRSNYNYWITNKKFLGFTSYMEAGVQFNGGKVSPVFVPSVGVQLGPLLNINYYNMPIWLRIPAQFILSLEVRIGSVIGNGRPAMFSGLDLNYVF